MSPIVDRTLIGHLTVTEGFECTRYYETAAWYQNHDVQPGRYRVHAEWSRTYDGRPWAEYVVVTYNTVITKTHTPSLFGGVPIGGDTADTTAGTPDTFTYRPYSYQCPDDLADGAHEVAWLGGTFTPVDGARFTPCVSLHDQQRYGTRPTYVTDHIVTD